MKEMKEFVRKKLKNGLTILFEKRRQEVVSVSASVKHGSAYEKEKEKGISHFIEHLMFKGTKNRTHKEIAEEIEKRGGVLNAYTGEEVTCYWNKLPSKYFSFGMDVASDLILNPKFDKEDFEKEKKVILEEIKMYHDSPGLYVMNKLKEMLFKKPFGLSALGDARKIKGMKGEEITNYFKRKYASNKMILCVVGNTSIDKIEKFAKRFQKTKAREEKAKITKIYRQCIEKRKDLQQAHLALGFHFDSQKRYAYDIFNTILAGGMSSRLFEEIREKRGLVYDIKGFLECGKNYGYQIIYAGTTKEKAKLCKDIILKEIEKMKELNKKDFEECKEQLIGLKKIASEESVSVMNNLIGEEILGDARNFYRYDNKILAVRLEEVRQLAKIKNFGSLLLIPKNTSSDKK